MAIAKVVKLCPDGEIQDVCVLNFDKCIILRVDKTSEIIKVVRTELLHMLGGDYRGPDAIIALLSNNLAFRPISQAPTTPSSNREDPPLTPELLEKIFEYLATSSGKSIQNFALTCKQFASIVHDRTIVLPDFTILAFPTGGPEFKAFYYAVGHVDGKIRVVYIGRERLQQIRGGRPTLSETVVLIDGVDVGLMPFKIETLSTQEIRRIEWNIDGECFHDEDEEKNDDDTNETYLTSDNFDDDEDSAGASEDNEEESEGESNGHRDEDSEGAGEGEDNSEDDR